MRHVRIRPLDPIFLRDGRPFDATPGIRAYSALETLPSVVARTIRTMLAKQHEKPNYEGYAKVAVEGPLFVWKGEPFFPMPQDIGFYEDEDGEMQINYRLPTKLSAGQGYLGIPTSGEREHDDLWPAKVIPQLGKVSSVTPAYISLSWMSRWLSGELTFHDWAKALKEWQSLVKGGQLDASVEQTPFLPSFLTEERDHISIDYDTGITQDGDLFTTQSVVFPEDLEIHTRVDLKEDDSFESPLSSIHSLGGKRRLAHFSETEGGQYWNYPEIVEQALDGQSYVKLVLATPAYFRGGWKPRWLDENLCTNDIFHEEICPDITLQLVWSCTPRWQPISGWSYKRKQPKAVRRLVPAGSVYFFKVIAGDPGILVRHNWLTSISDSDRRKSTFDREDGFGLALWGTWQPSENKD